MEEDIMKVYSDSVCCRTLFGSGTASVVGKEKNFRN
jgi:hypothetical protein